MEEPADPQETRSSSSSSGSSSYSVCGRRSICSKALKSFGALPEGQGGERRLPSARAAGRLGWLGSGRASKGIIWTRAGGCRGSAGGFRSASPRSPPGFTLRRVRGLAEQSTKSHLNAKPQRLFLSPPGSGEGTFPPRNINTRVGIPPPPCLDQYYQVSLRTQAG